MTAQVGRREERSDAAIQGLAVARSKGRISGGVTEDFLIADESR
jgi:hypothetical protein